ncbi:MAG: glycosyl transferase [Bifidobacteriaceae bacterium]|nr:glycosyl transferase [Bifidobacteriaceae bacterium]
MAETYGYFDDAAREYVITTPHTPYPWINYLGSQEFFSLISHQAGGYSFYRDAKLRRLTRFRYNNIPPDTGGRYVYIRDGDDYWTPSFAPVRARLDRFEARHGLGYTKILGERGGVRAESVFFVPLDVHAEVHALTLTNLTDQPKHLRLYSYLEFCLWNAEDDSTNYQRNLSLGEVEVEGSAIYHVTEYRERRNHFAVFGVNAPLIGFDTDRDAFLGTWGSLASPKVVDDDAPTGSVASGWYPIASHAVEVDLAPGQERQLVFTLGYIENPRDAKWQAPGVVRKDRARELLAAFQTSSQVAAALERLADDWSAKLSHFAVDSADDKLNRSVNIWNPYQCMVTFNLSRSASYFETGLGRGMGFRDSNQDLVGFVHIIPERARERILDLAATQLPDGSAYHQFQPLTKRGNDAIGSGFNDDPLWLILGTAAYIKETGDLAVLDEAVPFDSDSDLAAPLIEHLQRSWDHVIGHLGPHGLPLIGRADWNDCLNLNVASTTPGESFQTAPNIPGGAAESVMIAGLFTLVGPDFVELLTRVGRDVPAAQAQRDVETMRDAIVRHGWDGEWFLRAYDHAGRPVGTHTDTEGQIFIESQGLAIMGGAGHTDGRAQSALASVAARLANEHGIALVAPAFRSYRQTLGEITTYPPGYKENGGVFCHTVPWVVIAETMVGDPRRAFDYYRRITPAYREAISDIHRLEPYAYAQMIAGPEAPRFGEAKNSWLTGTAAWNFAAVSQYLLGVRAGFDGLIVDPTVAAEIGPYTVTREFRGATYRIAINATPPHLGALRVDGKLIAGQTVPVADAGATVDVVWETLA